MRDRSVVAERQVAPGFSGALLRRETHAHSLYRRASAEEVADDVAEQFERLRDARW